jgi:uncharacterized protein YjiS (DUF1127 family)
MTRFFAPSSVGSNRGADTALGLLGRAVTTVQAAFLVRRQRRALMALDDRMLADIGLSRSQAYLEATRPMIDLPDRMG